MYVTSGITESRRVPKGSESTLEINPVSLRCSTLYITAFNPELAVSS